MIKWRWLFLSGLLLTLGTLSAQTLRFSLPDTTVAPGTTLTLPIRVMHFDSIVSVQFSLMWDTNVIEYVSNAEADLENVAIGDFQADQGELRFSWFNEAGDSRTLPDGSSIIDLMFNAVGAQGDSTFVPIVDEPIAIQVAKATDVPGEFELLIPEQDVGLVRIGSALGIVVEQTTPACPGDSDGSIQLALGVDTTQFAVTWMGPDGFTATGYNLTDLIAGTYTAEIRDAAGELVETLTVVLADPAPIDVTVDISSADCNSSTATATISPTGGTGPFVFNLAGTVSDDGVFPDLAPGEYPLQLTDANDCTFTTTITVEEAGGPSLEIPSPQFLCAGTELVLFSNISGTYQWSTGSTDSTITVTETGTYGVTVTNSFNCTASSSIEVLPGEELEASIQNDFLEFCPGDTMQLVANGGTSFTWLDGDDILSATDIADPLAFPDENRDITLITSNDCATDTLVVPLLVFEVTATAGPDTCIAPGDPAQLMASGGIFYEWLPNPFPVSDPNIPNPVAQPEDSTTYVVTITDINGCVTTDDILVLVANDPRLSIRPINLITPNGDGKNDVLEFFGADKFGTNTLKVYNRWGKVIYQKVDYQNDDERFDGTYQGEPVPAGTYYYVLSFRSGDIKQTLTIVRE